MLSRGEILAWLNETDPRCLEELWRRADATRAAAVGDAIHLRGLIEFSNHCDRHCLYCGIRSPRRDVKRYRMSAAEILDCARVARRCGYGTVVLQSGEEKSLDIDWMCTVVQRIKNTFDLAVTLSLGERSADELAALKEAGADRYLLRFETSNPRLFDLIHPACVHHAYRDRIELLYRLRELGYEVGSGVMIGIPGQSYEDLADDLELFEELDLDMVGVGPFIAHPDTPLGRHPERFRLEAVRQVPAGELMTYKVLALTRLMLPLSNLPSTTALATVNHAGGREGGLQRGANVIMPNLTPARYRAAYEIYPDKAFCRDEAAPTGQGVRDLIRSIGRIVGAGPGNSANFEVRNNPRRVAI